MKSALSFVAALVIVLTFTGVVHAQDVEVGGETAPQPKQSGESDLMTRFGARIQFVDTHKTDNPYAVIQSKVGVDIDLFDNGQTRVNFDATHVAAISYKKRLGTVSYYLAGSITTRLHVVEFGVEAGHKCDDKANVLLASPPSWNFVGMVARRKFTTSSRVVYISANWHKVVSRDNTDVTWTSEVRASIKQNLTSTKSIYGAFVGDTLHVTKVPGLPLRNQQWGAYFEGGFHITGRNGSIEIFSSYGRDPDAIPGQRQRRRYVGLIGVRLLGGGDK